MQQIPPGWRIEDNKLVRELIFANFTQALDFVNKLGELAEKAKHHPDILLHSYKNVKITLFTHEVNKLTDKDFSLAKQIEKINYIPLISLHQER